MSSTTLSCAPVSSNPPKDETLIPCRCGLRPIGDTRQCELWIESPRTGARIVIPDEFWRCLDLGTSALVVKAAAAGQHVANFTKTQLRVAASLAKTLTTPSTLTGKTPLDGGWSHRSNRWGGRRGYSRSWGR